MTNLPDEYIYFALSSKFGWTPNQIDEMPEYVVEHYLKIMSIENECHEKLSKRRKR